MTYSRPGPSSCAATTASTGPAPGSRALPDGEIETGTPIPALVPMPTLPMAPIPPRIVHHEGRDVPPPEAASRLARLSRRAGSGRRAAAGTRAIRSSFPASPVDAAPSPRSISPATS